MDREIHDPTLLTSRWVEVVDVRIMMERGNSPLDILEFYTSELAPHQTLLMILDERPEILIDRAGELGYQVLVVDTESSVVWLAIHQQTGNQESTPKPPGRFELPYRALPAGKRGWVHYFDARGVGLDRLRSILEESQQNLDEPGMLVVHTDRSPSSDHHTSEGIHSRTMKIAPDHYRMEFWHVP